jgi:ABC-type sulfate/molybdate transport systems ATPase subunit
LTEGSAARATPEREGDSQASADLVELMQLSGLENRYPTQLSAASANASPSLAPLPSSRAYFLDEPSARSTAK